MNGFNQPGETHETMTNEVMDDPKLRTQQRHVGKASRSFGYHHVYGFTIAVHSKALSRLQRHSGESGDVGDGRRYA